MGKNEYLKNKVKYMDTYGKNEEKSKYYEVKMRIWFEILHRQSFSAAHRFIRASQRTRSGCTGLEQMLITSVRMEYDCKMRSEATYIEALFLAIHLWVFRICQKCLKIFARQDTGIFCKDDNYNIRLSVV